MAAFLTGLTAYVPERIVTNDELARFVDTSDEWIVSHTGIRERRIAADDQAASDLAIEAARTSLARSGIAPSGIDLVIVASSSPDYVNFPSVASIVQDRIGAENAGAFDLAAGCTGFVYALETARAFVSAGSARNVLVIGSEVLTRITNWEDRNTCVLFGDGAGAAIVQPEAVKDSHEILHSRLRSKGSGDTALIRPAGGSRAPYDPAVHTPADMHIQMDGRKVYLFAVDALVRTIKDLCAAEGIEVEALDWVVPHQANLRIIEAAAKRLGLPVERFYTNLDRFANTSAASIPIAIDEMQNRGHLESGQMVLTVGFGAGLSYGGNLIRW
jgi:3-oxoacyl-[acyl-carrier-protein] synthase III